MQIKTRELLNGNYDFFELENWLEEVKKENMTVGEILQIFIENFSVEDIVYLLDAYHMPKKEIEEMLKKYDNANPKLDELKFINDMAIKYSVDKETIIRRIHEVRMLKNWKYKAKKLKIGKNSCIKW